LIVIAREAKQSRAQVVRLRSKLHQHLLGELARDLLEELVLAREVVIHGLLRYAGAARDVVDARGIAAREKRGGGGAQHAAAMGVGHRRDL
jgi:hypothetical protein